MTSIEEADSWIGRTAVDSAGEQIGMVTKIWVDDDSGRPEWASVRAVVGGEELLVPLAGSGALGGGHQFAYSRDQVAAAPQGGLDGHLEVEDMELLSAYYADLGRDEAMATSSSGWLDRMHDTAGTRNGSPITPSPPAGQPTPEAKSSRFGRRPPKAQSPSSSKPKQSGRRFGRKSSQPDHQAPDAAAHPDEVPLER